eukprot:1159531-Pelagomonas_calceolata.AAC.2
MHVLHSANADTEASPRVHAEPVCSGADHVVDHVHPDWHRHRLPGHGLQPVYCCPDQHRLPGHRLQPVYSWPDQV